MKRKRPKKIRVCIYIEEDIYNNSLDKILNLSAFCNSAIKSYLQKSKIKTSDNLSKNDSNIDPDKLKQELLEMDAKEEEEIDLEKLRQEMLEMDAKINRN